MKLVACIVFRCTLRLYHQRTHIISTYFVWNASTGSPVISDISTCAPLAKTSGCLRCISQPTCEKKNPLLALWGSASVSLNLWCTLWSLTQSNIVFLDVYKRQLLGMIFYFLFSVYTKNIGQKVKINEILNGRNK